MPGAANPAPGGADDGDKRAAQTFQPFSLLDSMYPKTCGLAEETSAPPGRTFSPSRTTPTCPKASCSIPPPAGTAFDADYIARRMNPNHRGITQIKGDSKPPSQPLARR